MQKTRTTASALHLILCAATLFVTSGALKAATCETLKGEMVGFGEQSTRNLADEKLNEAISSWETRRKVKATPKKQKLECKVYIDFLNEFECAAEAEVCR
jgi:hypothetical protein